MDCGRFSAVLALILATVGFGRPVSLSAGEMFLEDLRAFSGTDTAGAGVAAFDGGPATKTRRVVGWPVLFSVVASQHSIQSADPAFVLQVSQDSDFAVGEAVADTAVWRAAPQPSSLVSAAESAMDPAVERAFELATVLAITPGQAGIVGGGLGMTLTANTIPARGVTLFDDTARSTPALFSSPRSGDLQFSIEAAEVGVIDQVLERRNTATNGPGLDVGATISWAIGRSIITEFAAPGRDFDEDYGEPQSPPTPEQRRGEGTD